VNQERNGKQGKGIQEEEESQTDRDSIQTSLLRSVAHGDMPDEQSMHRVLLFLYQLILFFLPLDTVKKKEEMMKEQVRIKEMKLLSRQRETRAGSKVKHFFSHQKQ